MLSRSYLPYPPQTLREALEAQTVEDLRPLARLIASPPPTRKGELVALVCAHALDARHLERIVASLDDVGRALVAEAAHGTGEIRAAAFGAKYGVLPERKGWLAALLDSQLRMPADLRRLVRPLVPRPPRATLKGLDELPAPAGRDKGRVVRATEAAAQADVQAVLRLCEGGRLRVSEATRRPTSATMRAVAEVLEGGDFYPDEAIAAFAWPLLLQAGGLAALASGRLTLTARGLRALAEPPWRTLRDLWVRWQGHGLIDEFSRVEAIKGQQAGRGRNLTAPGTRRAAVADALAAVPIGRWIDVDAFFRYMRAADHDFELARDPWRLYVGDPNYGSLGYEGAAPWSVLQGRYVLCLLFEYAAVLGLVDVAYTGPAGTRDDFADLWGAGDADALSRYDGLAYFRLNGLGAYALGGTQAYAPRPAEHHASGVGPRVLPNLELAFLGERTPAADALLVERYAEPRTAGVWALSRERMLEAMERGFGLEPLESLLRRSGRPLPDAVAALLAEVRQRAAMVRDRGPVRLVECETAELAHLLANERRLRDRCQRVGERHLAVALGDEEAFRRALRQTGYALAAAPPKPAAAAESASGEPPRRRRARAASARRPEA